jgi:hypothetical protein
MTLRPHLQRQLPDELMRYPPYRCKHYRVCKCNHVFTTFGWQRNQNPRRQNDKQNNYIDKNKRVHYFMKYIDNLFLNIL